MTAMVLAFCYVTRYSFMQRKSASSISRLSAQAVGAMATAVSRVAAILTCGFLLPCFLSGSSLANRPFTRYHGNQVAPTDLYGRLRNQAARSRNRLIVMACAGERRLFPTGVCWAVSASAITAAVLPMPQSFGGCFCYAATNK